MHRPAPINVFGPGGRGSWDRFNTHWDQPLSVGGPGPTADSREQAPKIFWLGNFWRVGLRLTATPHPALGYGGGLGLPSTGVRSWLPAVASRVAYSRSTAPLRPRSESAAPRKRACCTPGKRSHGAVYPKSLLCKQQGKNTNPWKVL
jgi:hypothetical protein